MDFVKQPRAFLHALGVAKGYSLPSLTSVRVEALRSRKVRESPEKFEDISFRFADSESGSAANEESLPMHLKLALIFSNILPNLFGFSIYARESDVPRDIVPDCVWALSQFICLLEECPDTVIGSAQLVLVPEHDNNYNVLKARSLINARTKITWHLILSDRAIEAHPHAKALVEAEYLRGDKTWLETPTPFLMYGEVLVITRFDDLEAVKILRMAMTGTECAAGTDINGVMSYLEVRAFLARALRHIRSDEEAETHEKFLIQYLRKNPHLIPERALRHILLPSGPVLEGLGGSEWFERRKQTAQADERLVKACKTCGARDPFVTLSKCNSCKYTYYCSRACQRANWKHHKLMCREMTEDQEKIKLLSLVDPFGAQRAADWTSWHKANPARSSGIIHALGLHRDPRRARTHIVFEQVEYAPAAKKLKHKFHLISCGVFLLKDALRDIEGLMNLNDGEGQEYVDSLLNRPEDEIRTAITYIPYLHLSFGDNLTAQLGCGWMNSEGLREMPYDPDWRKLFNIGHPPKPMRLVSGVKDVEHVFE